MSDSGSFLQITGLSAFILLYMLAGVEGQGVNLLFMASVLDNGTSQLCLRDIGEVPSPLNGLGDSLACSTNSQMCCEEMGEWFINGQQIPSEMEDPNAEIYRNGQTGVLRLNVRAGAMPTTTGEACCVLPGTGGVIQTVCVQLVLSGSVCGTPTTEPTTQTGTTEPSTQTGTTEPTTTEPETAIPTDMNLPMANTVTYALVGVIVVLGLLVITLIVALILQYAFFKRKLTYYITPREYETPTTSRQGIELKSNEAYGGVRIETGQQTGAEYEYISTQDTPGSQPGPANVGSNVGHSVQGVVYEELH